MNKFLRLELLEVFEKTPAALKWPLCPSQRGQVTSEYKAAQQSRLSKSYYAGTGCPAFDIVLCPHPLTTAADQHQRLHRPLLHTLIPGNTFENNNVLEYYNRN